MVVDGKDVDELVRAARADLAQLSLELRGLQRAAAAQPDPDADDAVWALDLDGANDLLRSGVEARSARRMVERREEIERTQRDAAQRIAEAEVEAKVLVDSARAELLAARAGTVPVERWSSARRAAPEPATVSDDEGGEPVRHRDADWSRDTEVMPPVRSLPPVRSEPAPTAAPAPPSPALQPGPSLIGSLPVPTPAARRQPPARRSGTCWQGVLHADVLLPVVAVLILLTVLGAWLM